MYLSTTASGTSPCSPTRPSSARRRRLVVEAVKPVMRREYSVEHRAYVDGAHSVGQIRLRFDKIEELPRRAGRAANGCLTGA